MIFETNIIFWWSDYFIIFFVLCIVLILFFLYKIKKNKQIKKIKNIHNFQLYKKILGDIKQNSENLTKQKELFFVAFFLLAKQKYNIILSKNDFKTLQKKLENEENSKDFLENYKKLYDMFFSNEDEKIDKDKIFNYLESQKGFFEIFQ